MFSANRWIRERPETKKRTQNIKLKFSGKKERFCHLALHIFFHSLSCDQTIKIHQATKLITSDTRKVDHLNYKLPRSVDLKLFKKKYLKPADFTPHFNIPPRYQGTSLLHTEKASDVYYLCFQRTFYHISDPSKLDV